VGTDVPTAQLPQRVVVAPTVRLARVRVAPPEVAPEKMFRILRIHGMMARRKAPHCPPCFRTDELSTRLP